jgi:glucokinase
MAVFSIDFGGSHIACGIVEGKTVLAEATIATDARSLSSSLHDVANLLRRCQSQSGLLDEQLYGVAIGFCGIVDSSSGEILSTLNKYPDTAQVDLAKWAQQEFGLPVRVENDACLALLGEISTGAGRFAKDVVMVTLGTGLGSAAMLGGKLLRSRFGQAGCLGGHLPVNFRGRRCSCGAIGCAEAEASTFVLPLLCREHPGFDQSSLSRTLRCDFATVFSESDAGDRVACEIVGHCMNVWGALTVGLIHAYGPELVIFGGGVMQRGEALLKPIREYVGKHMWRTTRGLPRIEPAQLGAKAALLGGEVLFEGINRREVVETA